MRHAPTPVPPREAGFSLVEMMVAITISLILMAGIIQLLTGNKQAYRLQEGFSILNENARFAVRDISHNLRMADHWGGVAANAVTLDGTVPAISAAGGGTYSDCSAGWSTVVAGSSQPLGVQGVDGAASTPLATCIPNTEYQPNTDIVVARFADPEFETTANANASANLYVRSLVGRRARIIQGNQIDSDLPEDLFPDANGVYNYRYRLAAYFVRKCSVPGANNQCDASDDGGNPVPTLVRMELDGTALRHYDVVEGVEQLQATYGVDSDDDLVADRYYNATNVPDWSKVVSVRLSLIVRNPEVDIAISDTNTYQLAGGAAAGGLSYTPVAADRKYKRRLVETLIQVRNSVRG